MVLNELDQRLVAEIQGGLPLCNRPYAEIAGRLGISEQRVIERVDAMQQQGVIKRMGLVVRHRELGFAANAMVVWNVPDEQLDAVGEQLARYSCITLCYHRPRRLPEWPYNLFCMIHGKEDPGYARSKDGIKQLTEKGVTAKILEFDGGKELPENTADLVIEAINWMK